MKKSNKDYIKEKIRNNPNILVIAPRQVGKTDALLELLHEDLNSGIDAHILTFSINARDNLRMRYIKAFGNDNGDNHIVVYRNDHSLDFEKCYIDEYFFHPTLYKEFRGAVSSLDFPIVIEKNLKPFAKQTKKELKRILGNENYKKEFSMTF